MASKHEQEKRAGLGPASTPDQEKGGSGPVRLRVRGKGARGGKGSSAAQDVAQGVAQGVHRAQLHTVAVPFEGAGFFPILCGECVENVQSC